MKKVMFVVMMLVVVLLPGMGQAQESQGNSTLPFTLWLPVVKMPPIPSECLPSGVGAGYYPTKPPVQPFPVLWFQFNNYTYEAYATMLDDRGNLNGIATIAHDPDMQDVIFQVQPIQAWALPWFFTGVPETPGQTYYTKLEYQCLGFSVRTSVYAFTVPVPD